jgi:hypothetical protein
MENLPHEETVSALAPGGVASTDGTSGDSIPADLHSAENVSTARSKKSEWLGPTIALAAWIVPGLGHLVLRRWGRAAVFLIAVGGLAVTGYWMRGEVFTPRSVDAFGTLGFLTDACSGVFYFAAHFIEAAGSNVARAAGDDGTRLIAAAGIVNLLGILDACEIAGGRRG